MANSLRAKLSKLKHDGHITDAEYQAFIKKMDGHDKEIRAKAIDKFAEKIIIMMPGHRQDIEQIAEQIKAEHMKGEYIYERE